MPANMSILAVKVEPPPPPLAQGAMFDVLFETEGRCQVLLFLEMHDRRLLVNEAYAGLGPLFDALRPTLERFDEAFRSTRQATLELLSNDPDVVAWAGNQRHGALVVPGLAPYGVFFDLADRYRAASVHCVGRDVIDIRPGVGYGAVLIGPRARSFVASARDAASEKVLQRFCYARNERDARTADVVLALGVEAREVASALEESRRSMRPGGVAMVSACGEAGRDALTDAGLSPQVLKRPGLDTVPLDEYVVVLEPERIFPSVSVSPSPAVVSPRPLSVLFALRPSAVEAFGGDVVQVRMTAKALEARGHRVVVSTDAVLDTTGFDVVHLSNLTAARETLTQTTGLHAFTGPIVMMPIFIDHADETIWGMNTMSAAFVAATTSDDLERKLEAIAARVGVVDYSDGRKILPPPVRNDMFPNYTALQREIIKSVDYFIANAYSEMFAIHRHLSTEVPFSIAPSCCDPATYYPERAVEFKQKYGLQDFILSTGRIEPRKQQVLLTHIARRWPDRTVVLIGSNVEQSYGATLRAYWSNNVVSIPNISEPELAGAYAAARVFAMPSWDEVVSLSTVNAAACGASLVLTRNAYELEYIGDDAVYCDPGSSRDIARAIDEAWTSYDERAERRAQLSERVRREYRWDRAAADVERAYYRVLADNPRGRSRQTR